MSLQDEIDRLKQQNQALKEEFSHEPCSPESIRKQLADLVPQALSQISYLLEHSESDSVRLNASKYVIELARTATSTDDAIATLLKDLANTPNT